MIWMIEYNPAAYVLLVIIIIIRLNPLQEELKTIKILLQERDYEINQLQSSVNNNY